MTLENKHDFGGGTCCDEAKRHGEEKLRGHARALAVEASHDAVAIESLACGVSVNRACVASATDVCVVESVCPGLRLRAVAPSHSSARTTCLQRRTMRLLGL